MKPGRRNLWLVILAVALSLNLGAGFAVYSREADATGDREAFEKVGVMMQVLHLIRQDYAHPERVSYKELLYNAMRGMTASLDPFSEFMTAEEYKGMQEMTEGKFGGLGVTVTVRNGMLTVIAPIEGSPGSRAGIAAGDQIVKIAGKATKELQMRDAMDLLRGDPGTKVSLSLFRPSTHKTYDVVIERAIIDMPSVTNAQVLEGHIGYVRITEFAEPTAEKLGEALKRLEQQKVSAMILDLRNNPGGLLESAVQVCSCFLPKDKLVVSTEGRRPSQKQEFRTDGRDKFSDVPLVILVNQNSASAAEIVAGCLQDWNRAVLVGEKTFGKGSVQQLIPLSDGSALRLTTAMYFTPSRRVIHEHGIEPTIKVSISGDEVRQVEESPNTSDAEVGKMDPARDRQLRRAMETVKSYGIFLNAHAAMSKKTPPPAAAPEAPAPKPPTPAPAPAEEKTAPPAPAADAPAATEEKAAPPAPAPEK